MAKVFLAMPHSGSLYAGVLAAVSQSGEHDVHAEYCMSGCLTHNFNSLWCRSLNLRQERGTTHFAMCHFDVRPQEFWIKTLLSEMDRVNADILSAAIAIKDERGLTSMGVGRLNTWDVRRITIAELHDLPETFSLADTTRASDGGSYLAINTGLWICRFTDPWIEEFGGFRIKNTIIRTPDGSFAAFRPEDWDFSEWAHLRGLRVFATRKVYAWHTGQKEYGNDAPCANWTIDEECVEYIQGGRSSLIPKHEESSNGNAGLAGPGHDNLNRRVSRKQLVHAD